jgi:hypothetical protein
MNSGSAYLISSDPVPVSATTNPRRDLSERSPRAIATRDQALVENYCFIPIEQDPIVDVPAHRP